MAEKKTKFNVEQVKALYFDTLQKTGAYIPEWLNNVKFVEFKELLGGCATNSPESNTIYYRHDATPHAIFHELEHLRSRHLKTVVGFDDEKEEYVRFYFVGYHLSGFDGMFIEEGLNELSARKLYLKAIADNEELKKNTFDEYRENKYYHFEMFTCISLAYLLGLNIDDLRELKFSGDVSGQNLIKERVTEMSGSPTYWKKMQEYLDDFEMAKRMYVDEESQNKYKKESLTGYYLMAYNLLFQALARNKITIEDFRKRMHLFESYYTKSSKYIDGLSESVNSVKGRQIMQYKDMLVKKRVYTFAQSNKQKSYRTGASSVRVNLPQTIPTVSKSVAAKLFAKLARIKDGPCEEYASSFDDDKYGLT